MSHALYYNDALARSEHQAGLSRQLAASERRSEAVDWPHLIEAVEAGGRVALHRCESLLRQALVHLSSALRQVRVPEDDWGLARALPQVSPFTVDQLVSPDVDSAALAAGIAATPPPGGTA